MLNSRTNNTVFQYILREWVIIFKPKSRALREYLTYIKVTVPVEHVDKVADESPVYQAHVRAIVLTNENLKKGNALYILQ